MKMKVQCDVCEKAEATLVCCADEAALCSDCDNKIHTANKLASKHHRISLISPPSSSHLPKCDICQEKSGYFFCVEDRALLCRQCDVSIHSVNHLVAAHQRFLVTGIKVGLQPVNNNMSCGKAEICATTMHKGRGAGAGAGTRRGRATVSQYFSESPVPPGWRMDEFLFLPDPDYGYGFDDASSSKADNTNSEEFEWITSCSGAEEANIEEYIGQVPDIPSPPTASGIYWPRRCIHPTEGKHTEDFGFYEFYDAPLVPDIRCQSSPPNSPLCKRRKLVA